MNELKQPPEGSVEPPGGDSMLAAENVMDASPAAAVDDDALLLKQARRGDLEAVKEMLARHRDGLFGIAWGYLGDREEALDAVQEGLSKALSAIRRYDPNQPLGAWLSRIVRNVCLDRLRRLKFRRHASLEDRRERGAPDPKDSEISPERRLIVAEMREELRRAIATLRDEEREVIILRDVLDWPYARIEEFLGISHGTLASMIHRARARLRKQLGHLVTQLPGGAS